MQLSHTKIKTARPTAKLTTSKMLTHLKKQVKNKKQVNAKILKVFICLFKI